MKGMASRVRFAAAATCKGMGTQYHWVTGLTKEEREFARNGGILLVETRRPCGGNHGTTLRQIRDNGKGFKVPDGEVLRLVQRGLS